MTIFDMLLYIHLPKVPSFISNINVKSTPLIGTICTAIQSIYVKRASETSKHDVLDDMAERVRRIEQGQNYGGIMIFPEGTTNNGLELMTFKKGGFVHNCPIKVYALSLADSGVNVSACMVSELEEVFLGFSCLWNNMTWHEFDSFNPQYTYDKHGLDP